MRYWLRIVIVILATGCLLSTAVSLAAQGSDGTSAALVMAQANGLYEDGRFAEAAALYQQLLDGGIEDSSLYYNLGNAYFKQGDMGRAILNYERAARLAPRDADIQANLDLARHQAVDRYSADEHSAIARLASLARSWLTLNEMAFLTLLLWLLLILLIIVYRHNRPVLSAAAGRAPRTDERALHRTQSGWQSIIALVALLLAGGLFSLGSRLYIERVRPPAVVVAESVEVLSGPGSQYVTEFTLHSGAEVSLIETRGEWARLALPGDQLQGWVPAGTVVAVVER